MLDSDSGLHVSMRLLLGIVAGLIITDLLKVVVGTIGPDPTFAKFRSDDFALAASTLLFVTRVLIDNSLYYTRPDAKTITPAYPVRVFLIVCDLLSYALCYFVVIHAEKLSSGPEYYNRVRAIAHTIVLIEWLHLIWCLTALGGLKIPPSSDDYKPRRQWLKKWALLSGSFAALGSIPLLLAYYRVWSSPDWLRFIVYFSIASVIAYGLLMQAEYLGNWEVSVTQAAETETLANQSAPLDA